MLVFDQLKKNDPHLQLLTVVVLAGFLVLLTGLWWVQIVHASEYQSHLEAQTYRTVRLPALRGKILDRNGRVLAEDRATYDISLYLEDMRPLFDQAFDQASAVVRTQRLAQVAMQEKKLNRKLTKVERKSFAVTKEERDLLRQQVRYAVASNVVYQISQRLQQPLVLDPIEFKKHYDTSLVLPFRLVADLTPVQIARFEEQSGGGTAADLEMQTVRVYPQTNLAAHVLGELRRDAESTPGEEAYFSYRLPDYRGVVGIEGNYDAQLHGHAGEKSVLVNNLGYRQPQADTVVAEPEPGSNVVLTLDLDIQKAAERALVDKRGVNAKGAVVVMDVQSGDVLAMVSSPTFDPNDFVEGISQEKYQGLQELTAEKNRATYENYAPGSIFKTVVSLAALENGLNPEEVVYVQPNPENPAKGCIRIGRRLIKDTAPPGEYDFQKAFIHSSNSYFITNGLRAGVENIVRMGEKFHLGERTGLFPGQETGGDFPTLDRVQSRWTAGDTANLCIGQGEIAVTPLQMAVMTSAIANGGKVLWPRLVKRIEPPDPITLEPVREFPSGQIRDELGVHARSLKILREAMLADVETAGGTGWPAAVPGLRICGKTGTAQVQDATGKLTSHNYWFASFAPYDSPRYAVVVMVESEESGSGTTVCAPIAHDVYVEIQRQLSSHSQVAVRN